jgi:ribonuclease T2
MRNLPTICFLLVLSGAAFQAGAQQPGPAGQFDYYLLTLSWSPEFCHGHPSAPECSEHKGFMVHGLWPQFNNGTWPANCQTNQPGPTDTSPVANIMPQDILQHEWEKHGTCSGLSGNDYFALIRKVYDSIKIPDQFASPTQSFTFRPAGLKTQFQQSNPPLAQSDMAIELSGKYLSGVEICLTKSENPAPIACSSVKDVHGGTFIVPAVQ